MLTFLTDIKMNQIQNFALQIETQLGFEETIEIVTELLTAEGFGILTEIDVKATFRKKLDIDWEPHRILGACNPEFARKTLSAVPEIAVLLPCNFVVRDKGDHRQVQAMEAAGSRVSAPLSRRGARHAVPDAQRAALRAQQQPATRVAAR